MVGVRVFRTLIKMDEIKLPMTNDKHDPERDNGGMLSN